MATLNWPGFGVAMISPTLDQPSQSNSSTWTGTRTVITNPWHGKWSFRVTLATRQGDAAFQAARAFFTSLKGQINTFHLPAVEAPQNGNTGVTLSANAAQGATSIALTGVTTALVAGNMVTIAGQLLSLTSVNALDVSTHTQTVTFMPTLRAAASSGASVETAKPYALVYSDSSFTWDIGQWRRYGLTFNATEAVGETDGADPALDIWTGGVGVGGGGGTSFSFPQLPSFISRSLLAAVTSPTDKQVAYLTEVGREGEFVFSTVNLSAKVTADTAQGVYVAPASDTTGASGAWVRKPTDEIKGAYAGATFDNSTDDHVAIIAAVAASKALAGNTGGGGFYKGGPALELPAGKTGYMAANTLNINHTLIIKGYGAGRFGPAGRGASCLRYAAGATGIIAQHPQTSGDTTVDGTTHDGSAGLNLEHFMMQGPEDGVEASVDGSIDASLAGNNIGIDGRMPITGYDLYLRGFRGIGIKGWAGTYNSTNYSGNTSLTAYYGAKIEGCQIAVDFRGGDANILNFFNGEAYQCTQAGFVFDVGIGPVVGVGLHTASNGMITGYLSYMCHHNGDGTDRHYAATWGKTIAQLTANAPPNGPTSNAYWNYIETGAADSVVKTWNGTQQFRAGGDIITAGPINPNQVACFLGGYSENPGVSQGGPATLFISSVIAKKYRIGGVHLYAAVGKLQCDESVHFGGGVAADGFTHTLGDNASATVANLAFYLDTTSTETGVWARYTGGTVFGYTLWEKNDSALHLAPSSRGHIFQVGAFGSATSVAEIDLNGIYPVTNNSVSCGKAGNRWTEIFATNGTINTSDERHKTSIASPDDRLLDAWAEVDWHVYQMKDAVKAKGKDGARIHVGIIAQRVQETFARHGLDGFRLGLLCFDKWDDEFEPVFEIKEIEEDVKIRVEPKHEGFDWVRKDHDKRAEKRKGKPGKWVRKHRLSDEQRLGWRIEKRKVQVQAPKLDENGERVMQLRWKAGELFGVRYEEALSLEAALQRRTAARFEQRLQALERRA